MTSKLAKRGEVRVGKFAKNREELVVRPRAWRGQGSCRIEGCPDVSGLGGWGGEERRQYGGDHGSAPGGALEASMGSGWDPKSHMVVRGVGG